MAVSLKHAFQSSKGDGTDATLVQPSNWNAEHVITCGSDSVLGRTTTAGAVTEIPCTAYGRQLIASADATAARTTLSAASAADVTALTNRLVATGNGLTGGGNLTADRTLAVSFATQTQWRTATQYAVLDAKTVWDAMAETSLTDAATVAWDMSLGFDFVLTMTSAVGSSRTIGAPTNTKVGQKGRLVLIQDSTGNRTVNWNSAFKFVNGTKPTLSTTGSAADVFYYDVRSSTFIILTFAGRAFA